MQLTASGHERLKRQLVDALRDHLATRMPARIPEAGHLAWQWFLDLHATRTYGFAPNPISYGEIEAYARLHRLPLEARHVALIRSLDDEWIRFARTTKPDGTRSGERQLQSAHTAGLFDARFG